MLTSIEAYDSYAARPRTALSCSSNRFRFRASRSSRASGRDGSGLTPSSTSARRIHFVSVIGWAPRSFAICSSVITGSRLRAMQTTSSRKLLGIGLGHEKHLSRPALSGKPNQTSSICAADPLLEVFLTRHPLWCSQLPREVQLGVVDPLGLGGGQGRDLIGGDRLIGGDSERHSTCGGDENMEGL